MTGFSFGATFGSDTGQLTRELLAATQRRARSLGLEVHYRRTRQSGRTWLRFDVTVDGPLIRMEALFEQLVLELPSVAEGARHHPVPPRERVGIAWDVIDSYFEGMKDARRLVFDMHQALGLGQYGATPMSYVFDARPATHLTERLRKLTRTLGMFRAGYLPPEQVVEEVHTVAESLLRETVGKGGSFPAKVERAHAEGYLTHEMQEDILRLNRHRVGAKHKGQEIPTDVAVDLVNFAVRACQALLLVIAQSDALTSTGHEESS